MNGRTIPYLLIGFRFAVGPAMLALVWAFGRDVRYLCTALLASGVLSDIFDGVIARKNGSSTPSLRMLDSRADVAFWLCAVLAVIKNCPEVRTSLLLMGGFLVGMEFVAPIVSLIRFRREASTHHVLSKMFGLGLWLLLTVLFPRGSAGWLQLGVFALGVASQL